MADTEVLVGDSDEDQHAELLREMEKAVNSGMSPKAIRFALSVLGGVIPGGGGLFSAVSGAWSEREQARVNAIFAHWIRMMGKHFQEVHRTIEEMVACLDSNDSKLRDRMESPEYLALVNKAFRDWGAAESEEKRRLIRNLLCHAAETRICSDDVVRLFIEWIAKYNELHFRVIKEVYQHSGITRAQIWSNIHGAQVPENSAEADLFKLLIHDLSLGLVIRQHRETDADGSFLKERSRSRPNRYATQTMKSAFDDDKPYELTELGKQFV